MLTDGQVCGFFVCGSVLVLALVNFALMWMRAARDIRDNPEKKKGYVRLLCSASLIYVPFLFAGLALVTGLALSPSEFFERDPPSPARIAFDVVMASSMFSLLVFVWFFKGLQLMLTHSAMFTLPWSPIWMKVFWGGMSVVAVLMFGPLLVSDFQEILK